MLQPTDTSIVAPDQGPVIDDAASGTWRSPGDLGVEHACQKIQARLDGLRPYVVEFNLLRVALMGIESRKPESPDRPRTRSEQAFAAIFLEPGLTTQEVADDSGIALSSLYPVLRALEDQGLAHRISRCWYPGPRDPGATSLLGVSTP